MIKYIELSKRAQKNLTVVPLHVAIKLKSWVELVESSGIHAARRIPGYHDEPLKGNRKGQRSIRLSQSYRAFYSIEKTSRGEKIIISEVNKHEY